MDGGDGVEGNVEGGEGNVEGGEGGEGGVGGGEVGEGGEDGEGGGRGPQSVQSWPRSQSLYSAPGPPSSQTPSLLNGHALVPPPGQLGVGGDNGDSGGGDAVDGEVD